MERLTNPKLTVCDFCDAQEKCGEDGQQECSEFALYKRLAAFEDTGLTPEEIMGLCEMDRRAQMADLLRLEEYQSLGTVEELAAWKQARDDGRLVVLPCKVGNAIDTLFSHNEIIALWYDKPDDKHYSHLLWRGEAWRLPEKYRSQRILRFKGIVSEKISESDTIHLQVTPYIEFIHAEAEAALGGGGNG